jgi:putative exosortase-associated protein (TIGR04073 family)
MRNTLTLLAMVAAAGVLTSGCANTERKFGRGMANTYEVIRGGEFRRTVEQTAIFESPDTAYTMGFVRGMNRSLVRTGVGIYEIITAPFPPYEPVLTDYMAPGPVYPDNYVPRRLADPLFATDTSLGFSGGDIFPMIPGSRFRVFEGP